MDSNQTDEPTQIVVGGGGDFPLRAKIMEDLRNAGHEVIVTGGQRAGKATMLSELKREELEKTAFVAGRKGGTKAHMGMFLALAAAGMLSSPSVGGFSSQRRSYKSGVDVDYSDMEVRVLANTEALSKAEEKRQRKMARNKALLQKLEKHDGNI